MITQYSTTSDDEARIICSEVSIPFSRSNHRRVTKARQIIDRGMVRKQAEFKSDDHTNIWLVRSQTDETQIYTVMQNGSLQCTCLDHEHGHICKHSIAAHLRDEADHEAAMETEWEAKMSAQFGSNPDLW
jgi:uncharacterized Zn finger protein